MTTIALFGATGKTGRRVLERALDNGHNVRALVRDPRKLNRTHERLTVISGDVLDPATVAETVAGANAVLALFGQVKGSPRTLQADGLQAYWRIVRPLMFGGDFDESRWAEEQALAAWFSSVPPPWGYASGLTTSPACGPSW